MRLVAIVGSASNAGKTALACAVLRAIPGLGAVKISPREGPARVERGPGEPGKDTARYAESGAVSVARLIAPRDRVSEAWEQVRRDFEPLPGVVVEGAGALELPGRRFNILVVAPATLGKRPERDERLGAAADCALQTLGLRLLKRSDSFGPGFPFSEKSVMPCHVTNTCAEEMGIETDDPCDFKEWAKSESERLASGYPGFPIQ